MNRDFLRFLWESVRPTVELVIESLDLPHDYGAVVESEWLPLAQEIARRAAATKPLVVGINGAQGSGKTTLCKFLEPLLAEMGLGAVTLSIDDLYLTADERRRLARRVHPLLATRGVPGTHNAKLGITVLESLKSGRPVDLPRFDKSRDDRAPGKARIDLPVDVILFEGWCVAARPQDDAALATPVNELEATEDPDGTWRRYVNDALRGDYAELFARIDMLVMLKVPDFDAVRRNRALQEDKLRALDPDAPGLMDAAALKHFLDQDERLTLHMFAEMPARADVLIEIDREQRPFATTPALPSSPGS